MNQTATDYRAGTLRFTGIPTDFALENPNAFFVVQRGETQLLTRAGNFHLASDGRLLTQDGDGVLFTDNTPIQLDPELPWRALPGGSSNKEAGKRVGGPPGWRSVCCGKRAKLLQALPRGTQAPAEEPPRRDS
jgi:hypothetical protein